MRQALSRLASPQKLSARKWRLASQMMTCSAANRRTEIASQGKAHMERLEAMRKLFTKSRALSLAQRALLYAKDELEMCTMRMRVRYYSQKLSIPCCRVGWQIRPRLLCYGIRKISTQSIQVHCLLQLRYPQERVKANEAHFKLFAAEIPAKYQVCLTSRSVHGNK